jgi:hypothetical protein
MRLTEDLASNVLAPGLLVVHNTGGGGLKTAQTRQAPSFFTASRQKTYEDDVAERTGGEEQVDPRLDLSELDVEAGRDDSALVDAAVELNDNLARAVVILFETKRALGGRAGQRKGEKKSRRTISSNSSM